jgi:hypothetical protein
VSSPSARPFRSSRCIRRGGLRAQVNRVAAEQSLTWAEYQARDDIISFHKFDPVRLRRFKDVNAPDGPIIRRVQIHEMVKPETLARTRFNFMRLSAP